MSAHQSLRLATQSLHERVEAAVDLPAQAERDYRALLVALLALFEPVEARLAALPWAEAGLDLRRHLRAPLLRADLRALGVSPADAPRVPAPAIGSLAAGFGALYVLEGSALGGTLIARRAAAALGLGPEATRFFRSEGRDVGPTWRAFLAALDAYVVGPERLAAAVQTAAATFEAFERSIAPT